MSLDLVLKNVRVVRPAGDGAERLDIGVADGKIAQLAPEISPDDAKSVVDGKGQLVFPGLVDAHMHVGIYSPLADDAVTESKAAAMGGVTSAITYFRTGQYYLNKGGSYEKFYPEVLDISAGNYWVDYAYHLAPIAVVSHRRNGVFADGPRRLLIQDLHVLRRLRPARQNGQATRRNNS